MTVVDEAQHSKKYTHLRLVEFLELLCRVALDVNLPGEDGVDAENQKENADEIPDKVFKVLEVLYNKLYAHGVASNASCPLYQADGAKDSSDDGGSDDGSDTMVSARCKQGAIGPSVSSM